MGSLLKNASVYHHHRLERLDVYVDQGKIRNVWRPGEAEDFGSAEEPVETVDLTGQTLVPGFLDIHTHGAVGVDVNTADAHGFEKICRFFASQGTTGWLCSIVTDTREQTLSCIKEYQKWKQEPHKGARLLGIHLEGPFLSAEYKGAMPEHLLQKKPNPGLVKEYQDAAGGGIRYITVSPELEGIPDFIPYLKELGMQVAIGHSGADYETARWAIRNGAAAATHTGNAMKLLHQHFPAIWGAVLEDDEVCCEVVCDGRHLHPGVVRLILKTKGLEHVAAITDSIMAAGLPDGEYKLGVNDVIVTDGDAKLKENDVRAGSTLTTGKALKNLLEFTGRPICDILPLLTENPAKLIGVYDRVGSIEPGKDADCVALDESFDVVWTMVKGVECYRKS